ncbi:hypothetical protein B5K03_33755 [Rhizobium phaseoli]|nr:hypothetical protein B5K03_33755 [Rhizobium phaseoli]
MSPSWPGIASAFPDEIYTAPESGARKTYPNLVHYNSLPKGGHLAAEQPQLLAAELRATFSFQGRVPVLGMVATDFIFNPRCPRGANKRSQNCEMYQITSCATRHGAYIPRRKTWVVFSRSIQDHPKVLPGLPGNPFY